MDLYKTKYLKYKTKYIQLKNQYGGSFKTDFQTKLCTMIHNNILSFNDKDYEIIYVDDHNIEIKNEDCELKILFDDDLHILKYSDKDNNLLDLLKEILSVFNLKNCQFTEKYFDDENLFKISDKMYILLNTLHKNYAFVRKAMMPAKEYFYSEIKFEKEKRDNNYYFTFDTEIFEILDDEEKNIIIKKEDKNILKFNLQIDCTNYMDLLEYNDNKNLLDEIIKMFNIQFVISIVKICDECVEFNKKVVIQQEKLMNINFEQKYIYLNKKHKLFRYISNVLDGERYSFNLGISKDLLSKKLYSINFIWLRVNSFDEKCFSIMGSNDIFININTIDSILQLQENEFFIKLINFSKNNPNALINFWIDETQLKTTTIINLRLVFDILNKNLNLNLCIRDVWNLKITNQMNEKYPNILPKCSGVSLILKVDLYKCMVCVEELERQTYSVFADLDMKPIGESIILSENNISILNRLGLVLTKSDSYKFENGFQILGSQNPKIRCSVIETFDIFMIERTMIILSEIILRFPLKNTNPDEQINNAHRFKKKTEQLVYSLYNSMYKYLYYNCGYGLYYINDEKYTKMNNKEEILKSIKSNAEYFINFGEMTNIAILNNFGIYISYELLNNKDDLDNKFLNKLTLKEIINIIKENTTDELITNYNTNLRDNFNAFSPILDSETLYGLPVKMNDLIVFDDKKTLPVSSGSWPYKMCKKYIKLL